jgi:MFS family permease
LQSAPRLEANIWKYYLFAFFQNFQLWLPIWIIYLTEERGLTLGQVTLIDVPFWLSIIILQVPAAAIADRFGRRPTLIACGFSFAAAVAFFGLATNFWLLLGSYLIWGIAFSLLSGTESAFIYDSLKALGREAEYPRIYGRSWAVAMAAGLAGTLLGAPIADATNLSFPIVASGGLAALSAVAAITFTEPLPEERGRNQLTYGQIIRESGRIVRDRPAVRYGVLFYGLITLGSIAPIFFFQPFLREHGIGLGEVGLWQTPMRITGILGALAAQRIIASLGERGTFYAMPLTIFASYLVLAAWDSPGAQFAFSVMNFVVLLSYPTVTDFLNRRVESEERATVLSMTNLMRSLILIPSTPLLGQLAEESLRTAFLVGAVLVAAMGVPLMLAFAPHLSRAHRPVQAPEPVGVTGGK